MAKKKNQEIEEALEEAIEAQTQVEVQTSNELDELKAIHKSLTDKGIKDIGQLEVLISRLQ